MTEQNLSQQPPKRRGCLFYGCLTCTVLLLLALVLLFAVVHVVKKQISAYTDAAPVQLPKVEMAEAEFQGLQQRVTSFNDAMQQGKPAEPLILTDHEINALIARSPNMKDVAGKVYVSLTNNQVHGQVSIPIPNILWLTKGRYLNGEAVFNVSLDNGVLVVTAQQVQVRGTALPEAFMTRLRQENLAKEIYRDPQKAEVISKLESIQVEDNRAVIKAREAK